MVNKCAKFHGDTLSCFGLLFIPANTIELSETANFVYNFAQKPYRSEQF